MQPTSLLDLAGVAVATPAAGLVKMKVLLCLGVALICLACVSKQFGPFAVYGKSNRAADSMCEHLLALVNSVVEEGEVLGVEFVGGKVGEVADLFHFSKQRI